ncbi:hypothetical protein K502DRAFT_327730 [Neoconidiobolus thromboides FSU 785]|nr:hypothetical protein K502DRAFT_327730 [Neoconidiobolus thromboides FSU 785]
MEIITTNIYRATNQSFMVNIHGKLLSPIGAKGYTYPSKMTVNYNGKEIGLINLPKLDISSKENEIFISDKFIIKDQEALSQFSMDLITEKKLKWTVQGYLDIYAFWMRLKGIYLKQEMELMGMDGLKGIQIKSINLPGNHELGGIKIEAKTNLFNPSNNELQLGSVKYGMFYKGIMISEVIANNLKLIIGDNELNLNGRILRQSDSKNLKVVSEFVTRFIRGDTIPILIKGLDLYPSIVWLKSAILKHEVELDYVNPDIKDFVKDIDILTMATDFTHESSFRPILASNISAKIDSPFDFPYDIIEIKENLNLYKNSKFMAQLQVPFTQAKTIRNGKDIKVLNSFDHIPLNVNEENKDLFEKFITEMVYLDKSTVHVLGQVDTVVRTDIGDLQLSGIKLDVSMNFPGMKGMKDPPPKLSDLKVVGSDFNKILFKSQVIIENPTTFSGKLGDVQLLIYYQNVQVGKVIITQFQLKTQAKSYLTAIGYFQLPDCRFSYCYKKKDLITQDFLSKYINGENMLVDSLGYMNTSDKEALLPALSQLNYSMAVPKIPKELLKSSKFSIFGGGVTLQLINPFDNVVIKITKMNALAYHNENLTAEIKLDFESKDPKLNPTSLKPIFIQPQQSIVTQPLPIHLLSTSWSLVWDAIGGNLSLNLTVGLNLHINDYSFYLNFTKNDVASKVTF